MTGRRHRKALATAAIDLHRLASDIRARRGLVPPDEPPGLLDAFWRRTRLLAVRCATARDTTCAEAKRLALADPAPVGQAEATAHARATMALLVTVNLHAIRAGLDPYEGMRGGDTPTGD